jgi:deoxycytidine triphosphate deaminase
MSAPCSVLSDGTILRLVREGRIKVDPWDPAMVQPASIDLRLGNTFRVFHNHRTAAIDLAKPPTNLTEQIAITDAEPFVIHPGEFVLGRTLEWVELPDDVVARIEGKAVALDTPIPTPDGWATMGRLQVGDLVFGPDGRPTPVVAATDVLADRECRDVRFCDGTSVICDVDHQWSVYTHDDRRRGKTRVVTARGVERDLKRGRDYRYRTRQTEPVEYRVSELPVDPYALGVWIGDATSAKAEVTSADPPILRELESAAHAMRPASNRLAHRVGGVGHARDQITGRPCRNASLSSTLRTMGLLGAKRIPDEYLQASVAQRHALLEGLMDADGHVDALGRCDLTTVKRDLAAQYHELISSLGYRPSIADKPAKLHGRLIGRRYAVAFTPHKPVFRLPRKLARQTLTQRFDFGRAIVDVKPAASVPVRCIEVGRADGCYLVTRSYIPTHNSSLGRLGLIVHATAGFVDPGWKGTLTLEITNLTRVPIKLWATKPIAQLSFMTLDAPALRPYGHPELGSHYHGQVEATESRYEGGPGAPAEPGTPGSDPVR